MRPPPPAVPAPARRTRRRPPTPDRTPETASDPGRPAAPIAESPRLQRRAGPTHNIPGGETTPEAVPRLASSPGSALPDCVWKCFSCVSYGQAPTVRRISLNTAVCSCSRDALLSSWTPGVRPITTYITACELPLFAQNAAFAAGLAGLRCTDSCEQRAMRLHGDGTRRPAGFKAERNDLPMPPRSPSSPWRRPGRKPASSGRHRR